MLTSVAHRAGHVDQQVGAQLGLFLEALDVVLVDAAIGPPVDVAQVVAGGILFVLGKLDRGAVVRGFVQTRKCSFCDDARR